MDDFLHEWFACPSCGVSNYVIWDPGQQTRSLGCVGCRRTEFREVIVKDENGEPLMAKNRTDAQGNPVPVTVNEPYDVGCLFEITRGSGLTYEDARARWGRAIKKEEG